MKFGISFIAAVLGLLMSFGAEAQVFSPQQNGAKAQTNAKATSTAQKQIRKPANVASKPQKTAGKSVAKDDNLSISAADAKYSKRDSYVNSNFDGNGKKEKKYDNSQRKVHTFKVVNGTVVFDESDRSILISYDNFRVHRSFDELVRCSIRIYVLNDLEERINNIAFKLHWPDVNTTVQMSKLNPGVRTYKDIMLLGDGCLNLDMTPTIEVNRCRVAGKTQEQCADAVKWYKKQ